VKCCRIKAKVRTEGRESFSLRHQETNRAHVAVIRAPRNQTRTTGIDKGRRLARAHEVEYEIRTTARDPIDQWILRPEYAHRILTLVMPSLSAELILE
jgi:hypothetical protein